MIGFILKYLDTITILGATGLTAIFLGFLAYSQPFNEQTFIAQGVTVALTGGALFSSAMVLIVVAFQDRDWFGNIAPYRFHIGIGCLVAVIASLSQIIQAVIQIV